MRQLFKVQPLKHSIRIHSYMYCILTVCTPEFVLHVPFFRKRPSSLDSIEDRQIRPEKRDRTTTPDGIGMCPSPTPGVMHLAPKMRNICAISIDSIEGKARRETLDYDRATWMKLE
jgi:hypothetical protein